MNLLKPRKAAGRTSTSWPADCMTAMCRSVCMPQSRAVGRLGPFAVGTVSHQRVTTFPNLAAQTAPYLEAQLHAFRDQTRRDPDALSYMWGMAAQLSDATIEAISAYYAAQPPSRAKTGDAKLMAHGKQIFEEGVTSQGVPACATCHGPQARGNDIFPRLAGQHADYLVKQALVIQSDLRASPIMHDVVKELSQDQMRAVATYLESLSP